MSQWLSILGIGEDGVEGLSPAGRALLTAATLVAGGQRHLDLAAPLITGETLPWPSPYSHAIPTLKARRGTPVVVLASGDPFCFGIGAVLAHHFDASEMLSLPAPSSLSLACARLFWPLHETAVLSLCGRPIETLFPLLHPGRRILILSADSQTPMHLARLLTERGFGETRLHVLEALGGPHERVRRFTAQNDLPNDLSPLNIVGLEVVAGPNARIIPLTAGLPDDLFAHDGQLTKQEIRAVTLAALAPCAGQLLWDIGCGSGSIGIEWMLRHSTCRAIGIERHPERGPRAAANATALGVPGLRVIAGAAPDALADLPTPDAVFIGGGASGPGVIDTAWERLRPGGRLVINAVALETEALLAQHCLHRGGTLTRLSVERLDRIGTLHAFRPAMTVTQWAATKP
jgi:precorrin-6Y C5,15-methyltransferase (decarboxylating)